MSELGLGFPAYISNQAFKDSTDVRLSSLSSIVLGVGEAVIKTREAGEFPSMQKGNCNLFFVLEEEMHPHFHISAEHHQQSLQLPIYPSSNGYISTIRCNITV